MTETYKLDFLPIDVVTAECGNRRQCVLAQGTNRNLGLGGHGYIRVDAMGLAFTKGEWRYRLAMNIRAKNFLAAFDKLGELYGLDGARAKTLEKMGKGVSFRFKLIERIKISPKASPARRQQINAARNARNAEKRARGEYVAPSPRYVGA
jgi:hypothetical protein